MSGCQPVILDDLKARGLLYKSSDPAHLSLLLACSTPLIYLRPRLLYVRTTERRPS